MARVLLVVFMAILGVQTFHTHACGQPKTSTATKGTAAGTHDACLLCVLQSATFLRGTAVAFHAIVAVSVLTFFAITPARRHAPARGILTRGPPTVC